MAPVPHDSKPLTYPELENRIAAWADQREDLRLAIVVGSRARSGGGDEWSDLDLVFFSTCVEDYTAKSQWLEEFGEMWASYLETTGQGYPEWFALYAGGLKLDIVLVSVPEGSSASLPELLDTFAHQDVLSRGVRLLVDRTGFLGEIPIPQKGEDQPLQPSREELQRLTDRFWITAAKAAKLINRGDLWRAKQAVDGELKGCLLTVIEWHARLVYRPGMDTWYDGRYLERWADPRATTALPATFARYDLSGLKRALRANIELYTWLYDEVAASLGIMILKPKRDLQNWLKDLTI